MNLAERVTWILLTWEIGLILATSCPRKCRCKLEQATQRLTAKCEGITQSDVLSLKELPPETTDLVVSNCSLQVIDFDTIAPHLNSLFTISIYNCTTVYLRKCSSSDYLHQLRTVRNVSIQHTSLETIRQGTLRCFMFAEHFSLSHNNIDHIYSGTFDDFVNAKSIDLSHNTITEIEEGSFNKLPKLEILDISYNKLKHPESLCNKLRVILHAVQAEELEITCTQYWFTLGRSIIMTIVIAASLVLIISLIAKCPWSVQKAGAKKTVSFRERQNSTEHQNSTEVMHPTENIFYYPNEKLGKNVFKGYLNDGREVAVKKSRIIPYNKYPEELDILLKLNEKGQSHCNVIQCLSTGTDKQKLLRYIALFPICPETLMDAISKGNVFHKGLTGDKDSCLFQLAEGLQFIHKNGVQHRDIKPKNILVRYGDTRTRFIITDFDLGHITDKESQHKTRYGTIGWVAPELWGKETRQPPVDVFSLGCVFYFVLTRGKHPFGKLEDMGECQDNITHSIWPQLQELEKLDHQNFRKEQATDLIQSMIQFQSGSRPDAAAIIDHPLFWNDGQIDKFYEEIGNYFDDMDAARYHDLREFLKEDSQRVFENNDWKQHIPDKLVLDDVKGKHKDDICALLKVVRDKITHKVKMEKSKVGQIYKSKGGPAVYYNTLFPQLLLCTYYAKKRFDSEISDLLVVRNA